MRSGTSVCSRWRGGHNTSPRQVVMLLVLCSMVVGISIAFLFSSTKDHSTRIRALVDTLQPVPPGAAHHPQGPDTAHQGLLPYPSPALETLSRPPPRVFTESAGSSNHDQGLKKILFWNDYNDNKHFGFGYGREAFLAAGCRVNTCTTTGRRARFPLEEVDALIWNFRSEDRSLPQHRWPGTRYVFWMMESASYLYGDLRDYKDVFNWTFTYRLSSDFPIPYGQVFRRRQPLPPNERNYAAGKTKLAAWFVSHCLTESGRENLVKSLLQWVPVDVFGDCGPLECPKTEERECYNMLGPTYKFYFSFENSLCRDYITEKLFNLLRLDVVPVVFGLGNYSAQAPPHSYVDALSFPSVGALAEYLLYLDQNDTAYNEYFSWKRFHQQFGEWKVLSQQFCELCERLHTDTSTKTYDLHEWYVEDAHCKTKHSPDIYQYINGAPKPAWLSFLFDP